MIRNLTEIAADFAVGIAIAGAIGTVAILLGIASITWMVRR